jgi:hypothetical protein
VDAFFDLSLAIPEEENSHFWYSGVMSMYVAFLLYLTVVIDFHPSFQAYPLSID